MSEGGGSSPNESGAPGQKSIKERIAAMQGARLPMMMPMQMPTQALKKVERPSAVGSSSEQTSTTPAPQPPLPQKPKPSFAVPTPTAPSSATVSPPLKPEMPKPIVKPIIPEQPAPPAVPSLKPKKSFAEPEQAPAPVPTPAVPTRPKPVMAVPPPVAEAPAPVPAIPQKPKPSIAVPPPIVPLAKPQVAPEALPPPPSELPPPPPLPSKKPHKPVLPPEDVMPPVNLAKPQDESPSASPDLPSAPSLPSKPKPKLKPITVEDMPEYFSSQSEDQPAEQPEQEEKEEEVSKQTLFEQYQRNFSPHLCDDLTIAKTNSENLTNVDITDILYNRYLQDNPYTYIGPVVISVNPYKKLKGVYNSETKHFYHSHHPYELAPHLYSLAEDAFRTLRETGKPQAVIISGESGSGKTEASKLIMEYLAAISISGKKTEAIKQAILQSNPLLEAFGNAKTLKNDNSSRFGKFMDCFFNFQGQLEGGSITTLLLEKHRVVSQRKGERNFHIFYQICSDETLRKKLNLSPPSAYHYLNCGGNIKVEGKDDAAEFKKTIRAMELAGIAFTEQIEIFKVVAGILELGNLKFKPKVIGNQDGCEVENPQVLNNVADIFQVEAGELGQSLTYRTILVGRTSRGSVNIVPQNAEKSAFNRDALAKALYERLFQWLVKRVNNALKRSEEAKYSIGILDIFGFEIFNAEEGKNYIEQFFINYVNEKIQQKIQHAIMNEQNEFVEEGVPVRSVKNFNCDECVNLIEKKPAGILAYLDEESLFPNGNDKNFLTKITKAFDQHKYFSIPRLSKDTFALKHYAADVPYDVTDWVEKNRDTLFVDIIQAMQLTKSILIQQLFPRSERLENKRKLQNTICNQFKSDVNNVIGKISGKKQHFVRCIIPNHSKTPDSFNKDVVADQVSYLGIVENVIIRKTGYCISMPFEQFHARYKTTSKRTFPKWKGTSKDACVAILEDIGIAPEKYIIGKTKVFLHSAEELFKLDACVESKKAEMATLIQKTFRKYRAKAAMKEYATLAASIDTEDIKYKQDGFMIDKQGKGKPVTMIVTSKDLIMLEPKTLKELCRLPFAKVKKLYCSPFADGVVCIHTDEQDYLIELDPKEPFIEALQDAFRLYVGSPLNVEYGKEFMWRPQPGDIAMLKFVQSKFFKQTTYLLEQDTLVVAIEQKADIFGGAKLRRKNSKFRKFQGDYIRLQGSQLMEQLKTDYGDKVVSFSAVVSKYNKHFKSQERILLITDQAMYNVDPNGYIINRRVPLVQVKMVQVSPFADDFFVVKVDDEHDFFLESAKKTEIIKVLSENFRASTKHNLRVVVTDLFTCSLSKKKEKPKEIKFIEDEHEKETKLYVRAPNAEVRVKKERHTKNDEKDLVKDIYGNLKMRRKESLLYAYKGDYLFLTGNEKFQKYLEKFGDNRIHFAAVVDKINKRFHVQPRKLVVGDSMIYNLDSEGVKLNSTIDIKKIAGITVSPLKDGFFCIHLTDDFDYFAQSPKKTELISAIANQYKQLTGEALQINVEEKYATNFSKQKGVKTVEFKVDSSVKLPTIVPHTNGILIKVNITNEDDEEFEAEQIRQRQETKESLTGTVDTNFRGIRDTTSSVYGGMKGRNRMTLMREFMGDYLRLEENQTVKKLLSRFGDKQIIFSGKINKVNNKFKMQERIIIVTEKAVYNLDPEDYKIKRRIPLDEIEGVSVSPFPDGIFVLHCPKTYDYIYDSDKKTEIILAINTGRNRAGKDGTRVHVGEQFEYAPHQNQLSSVSFVMDDNAETSWVEPTSKGLLVHVKHTQPGVILEAAYVYIKNQQKPIEVKQQPINIKMNKKWMYKLEIRFYVNEDIGECVFQEKIDTVTKRVVYETKLPALKAREERYVISLPERPVLYSLLSKTRVKAKLLSPTGALFFAIRFVYDVK